MALQITTYLLFFFTYSKAAEVAEILADYGIEPHEYTLVVNDLRKNPQAWLDFMMKMLESSYNLLFWKLALRCLFEDYFKEARHFSSRIMLKPIDVWIWLQQLQVHLITKLMKKLLEMHNFASKGGKKDIGNFKDLANWSCTIGYGLRSGSPLSPSFNFGLELAKNSQFTASFYQHVVVVQRRVKNPFEENEVVGITNYIDFGFELKTSIDANKDSNSAQDSSFQVAGI